MGAKISGYSFSETITPTIDTSAYADGDQLGNEMIIDPGIPDASAFDAFFVQSISLIDKAKQNASIDLFFFDQSVTPAADNAAASFSDTDLADCFLGGVSFMATCHYGSLADNSAATMTNVGLQLKMRTGATGNSKIYVYAVSRGSPTYSSTTDLVFKFHLAADL